MKLYCELNGKEYQANSVAKLRRALHGDFKGDIVIKKVKDKKIYRLQIDGVEMCWVRDYSHSETCCSNCKHCYCGEYAHECYGMCCKITETSCGDYELHHGCENFEQRED